MTTREQSRLVNQSTITITTIIAIILIYMLLMYISEFNYITNSRRHTNNKNITAATAPVAIAAAFSVPIAVAAAALFVVAIAAKGAVSSVQIVGLDEEEEAPSSTPSPAPSPVLSSTPSSAPSEADTLQYSAITCGRSM